MFLRGLEKEEKIKFIEMVYKVANCDNEFTSEEEELIDVYKQEMGITEFSDTASLEELVDYFSTRNETTQRVVWFELYSMINADDKISNEEENIENYVKEKFTISKEKMEEIEEIVLLINQVYGLAIQSLF